MRALVASKNRTIFRINTGATMGKLLRGANWFLEVRGKEHFPCHFHVIGPDFAAQIDVETLLPMVGAMPRAVETEVKVWAEKNRSAIVAEWNKNNPDRLYALKHQEKDDE